MKPHGKYQSTYKTKIEIKRKNHIVKMAPPNSVSQGVRTGISVRRSGLKFGRGRVVGM